MQVAWGSASGLLGGLAVLILRCPRNRGNSKAYRARIGVDTESVELYISSGPLETEPPELYAHLYWTTGRQVAGTLPFRPPGNALAIRYAALVMDRDLLAHTAGPEAFDTAVMQLAKSFGDHRGGILVDRPWDFDQPFTPSMGGAGPTGARIALFAIGPVRDGATDLDNWSPPFDLPL